MFMRIFTYRLTTAQKFIKQSGAIGKYKIIGRLFSFMLEELKEVEKVKEIKKKFTRKTDKGREVVRFQFEISPAVWESLEEFQRLGEIPTKRELLNNALSLFKWAMKHKEKGHSIVAVDSKSNSHEIDLPCFDAIEQNSRRKLRLVS